MAGANHGVSEATLDLRPYELRLRASSLARQNSVVWEEAYGFGQEIVELAKRYVLATRDRRILMVNWSEGRALVLPYNSRFSDGYRKRKVGKLRALDKFAGRGGVFLTLTVDPTRFNSLKAAYSGLMDGFNRLVSYFRRRHGRLDYARVLEFTKEGVPHLHVLFLGLSFLERQEKISELWEKYGVGRVVYVTRVWNRVSLRRYMLKYLTKSLSSEEGFRSLALSWALNARLFAITVDMDSKRKGDLGFEFCGVYLYLEIGVYSGSAFNSLLSQIGVG